MVATGVVLALLIAVLALIPRGFREADQPGDARVLAIRPQAEPRGTKVIVSNPGSLPLLVGMTLRRRSLRLHLEGRAYVRLRTHRTAPDLLASRQATLGVVPAGEEASFLIPIEFSPRHRAELVVVMGQPERLRSVHRAVEVLPQLRG